MPATLRVGRRGPTITGRASPTFNPRRGRQRPAHQDRVGPGQNLSPGRLAQAGRLRKCVIPERPLRERVDPQEQDGALVDPGEFQDGFHCGGRGRNRRQAPHFDEQGFVQRDPGGLNAPLGLAGHGRTPT